MSEENIREYNFAIPGNIDRHIPGVPGLWPFGSRVQVNEDTNEIVSVWPEGATPVIAMLAEEKPAEQEKPAPDVPPAVPETPVAQELHAIEEQLAEVEQEQGIH